MIEYPLFYQAVLFVNADRVEPSTENISMLLSEFKDLDLVPSIAQEFRFAPTPGQRPTLNFVSTDSTKSVAFNDDRIIVQWGADAKTNPGWNDFKPFAVDVLSRIINLFGYKSHRLSIVTRALLKYMTEDELHSAYHGFNQPLPFYGEVPPKEWDVKAVSRVSKSISGKQEEMNVIWDIKRKQGDLLVKGNVEKYDRLEIGFDINTYQNNKESRFGTEHIPDFIEVVEELMNNLIQQTEERLHGRG